MADWSKHAAELIFDDLTDRRGIRQAFDKIDEDIIDEIKARMAEIIEEAADGQ